MQLSELQVGDYCRSGEIRGRVIEIHLDQQLICLLDVDNDRTLLVEPDTITEKYDAQFHCKSDVYY